MSMLKHETIIQLNILNFIKQLSHRIFNNSFFLKFLRQNAPSLESEWPEDNNLRICLPNREINIYFPEFPKAKLWCFSSWLTTAKPFSAFFYTDPIKQLHQRCFPVIFARVFRTVILYNTYERVLLLKFQRKIYQNSSIWTLNCLLFILKQYDLQKRLT